jgi:hypothetical protein
MSKPFRVMLSFAVAVGLWLALVYVGRRLGQQDLAALLGVAPLTLYNKSQRWLAGRRGGSIFLPAPDGVRVEGFKTPWYELLGWATLTLTVGIQLTGFFAGLLFPFITGSTDVELSQLLATTATLNYICFPIFVFLSGRWIATQADRLPSLTIILAAVASQLVGALLTFAVLTKDQMEQLFGTEADVIGYAGALVMTLGFASVVGATAGLLGVWRGRKRRQAAYLAFVLNKVPPAARERIVRQAEEEVVAKVAESPANPEPSPAALSAIRA